MTHKGGTNQACAACRHQRRKCTPECLLAPYFPADQQKLFQNAHRLFGVRKITKTLERIDPSQQGEAMRSIICQANIRETYPVHGCCWVIRQLFLDIQQAEEELLATLAQLAAYRSPHPDDDSPSPHLHLRPYLQPADQALPGAAGGGPYNSYDNLVNPAAWARYNDNHAASNNASMALQSQLTSPGSVPTHHQMPQEYDEMHSFFDTIDDSQSYIINDSKEAYESSSESSLKDITQSIEQAAEKELKSAAACFSLTSVIN